MVSDRVKRNIWLTLAIVSVVCAVARSIQLAGGEAEWWEAACSAIITVYCTSQYLRFRKKVRMHG